MRKLNSVNVSPGNAYATIGGGAKVKEVRDALWDMDKWTGKLYSVLFNALLC